MLTVPYYSWLHGTGSTRNNAKRNPRAYLFSKRNFIGNCQQRSLISTSARQTRDKLTLQLAVGKENHETREEFDDTRRITISFQGEINKDLSNISPAWRQQLANVFHKLLSCLL
jgi:hypothetical protein